MKILFVCLGNICRSPIAQGLLETKLKQKNLSWMVDSAGTSGWHDGEPPDDRAIAVSQKFGVDISHQISRKITNDDLNTFDKVIVMDSSNYQDVLKLCKNNVQKSKVALMMNFVYPNKNLAVPDPYYDNKFQEVFELLDEAIEAMISHLQDES